MILAEASEESGKLMRDKRASKNSDCTKESGISIQSYAGSSPWDGEVKFITLF